ncbi:MAG TPA: Mur ligase domain-containing protein, partial [Gammaproteobacteria bacterium]
MMAALRHDSHDQGLQQLFAGHADLSRVPQLTITGLTLDSRQVEPGYLFLACAGTQQHGIRFIDAAIANGAVAVAVEPAVETEGLAP